MATSLLGRMTNVAVECLAHPGRVSYWIEAEGRYVCPEVRASRTAPVDSKYMASETDQLDPRFKLVFWAAVAGTIFFTTICVGLHLATTGAPPPLREKLIDNFFTMANIGFGALVGLLGGKAL